MMGKLSGDAKDYNIWTLRFKKTLKHINPTYATLLELIERLPAAVVTYENWAVKYVNPSREHSQTEEGMFTRMSADLYTFLVDKCTTRQVMMFENDELDGCCAYSQDELDELHLRHQQLH